MRIKSQINGVPKLQGIYRMKDEIGFPISVSRDIAKDNKWDIDWVEALVDALRQDYFKFEALQKEIEMLEPDKLEAIMTIFKSGMSWKMKEHPDKTACEVAEVLYQHMHKKEEE